MSASTPPPGSKPPVAAVDAYLDALLGAPPAAPEPEVVVVPEPKPEAAAEPEPEVAAVAEPEVVAAPEPKPEAAAEPEPEMAAVAEPETVAAPAPEPEAATEPEPEVAAAPAPPRVSMADLYPFLAPAENLGRNQQFTVPSGERWLRISLDEDRYAVELLRVQEVVRMLPIIAIRGAAPSLLGVMNLRGQVVPVHDLGRWLRRAPVEIDERARIVVLEHKEELLGILVTAVTDVITLDTSQIEPPALGARDKIGLGIARTPGAPPTVLLDATVLFD